MASHLHSDERLQVVNETPSQKVASGTGAVPPNINSLPNELLERIFTIGCEQLIESIYATDTRPYAIFEPPNIQRVGVAAWNRRRPKDFTESLLTVCRRWYYIATERGNAHLWLIYAVFEPHHSVMETSLVQLTHALRLSEGCDIHLDVYLAVPNDSEFADEQGQREVYFLLHGLAQIYRYRDQLAQIDFHFATPPFTSLIRRFLKSIQAAPRLRWVNISGFLVWDNKSGPQVEPHPTLNAKDLDVHSFFSETLDEGGVGGSVFQFPSLIYSRVPPIGSIYVGPALAHLDLLVHKLRLHDLDTIMVTSPLEIFFLRVDEIEAGQDYDYGSHECKVPSLHLLALVTPFDNAVLLLSRYQLSNLKQLNLSAAMERRKPSGGFVIPEISLPCAEFLGWECSSLHGPALLNSLRMATLVSIHLKLQNVPPAFLQGILQLPTKGRAYYELPETIRISQTVSIDCGPGGREPLLAQIREPMLCSMKSLVLSRYSNGTVQTVIPSVTLSELVSLRIAATGSREFIQLMNALQAPKLVQVHYAGPVRSGYGCTYTLRPTHEGETDDFCSRVVSLEIEITALSKYYIDVNELLKPFVDVVNLVLCSEVAASSFDLWGEWILDHLDLRFHKRDTNPRNPTPLPRLKTLTVRFPHQHVSSQTQAEHRALLEEFFMVRAAIGVPLEYVHLSFDSGGQRAPTASATR